MAVILMLLLVFAGFGGKTGTQDTSADIQAVDNMGQEPKEKVALDKGTDYPRIEELSWSFRNSVRYGEPVAAFDYTNNSNFTITQLYLVFKIKEGVTSEQLQLVDVISDSLISDEEIADIKPYVLNWIVCDPGETAENAVCNMTYNTEPTNAEQCDLMELSYDPFTGEPANKSK